MDLSDGDFLLIYLKIVKYSSNQVFQLKTIWGFCFSVSFASPLPPEVKKKEKNVPPKDSSIF